MTGTPMALGRDFRDEEGQVGRDQVVILTNQIWQERFGGDRAILGRQIRIDAKPYIVVGILAPGQADRMQTAFVCAVGVQAGTGQPRFSLVAGHGTTEARRLAGAGECQHGSRLASPGRGVPRLEQRVVIQRRAAQKQLPEPADADGAVAPARRGRRSSCSSPARTSRTCCLRAERRGSESWRFARRWAHRARGCSGRCSPRASRSR